jgi:hypothetical protein
MLSLTVIWLGGLIAGIFLSPLLVMPRNTINPDQYTTSDEVILGPYPGREGIVLSVAELLSRDGSKRRFVIGEIAPEVTATGDPTPNLVVLNKGLPAAYAANYVDLSKKQGQGGDMHHEEPIGTKLVPEGIVIVVQKILDGGRRMDFAAYGSGSGLVTQEVLDGGEQLLESQATVCQRSEGGVLHKFVVMNRNGQPYIEKFE